MLVLDERGDAGGFELSAGESSLDGSRTARHTHSIHPLRFDDADGSGSIHEGLTARGADDDGVVELAAKVVALKIRALVVRAVFHARRLASRRWLTPKTTRAEHAQLSSISGVSSLFGSASQE